MEKAEKRPLRERVKILGPGVIVAASFIGPGTVTTATGAGASFGFALLWAVVFSIITTIILQEMCSRLGIITGRGLGAAIRDQFTNPLLKYGAMWLMIIAIVFGCAAYIAGDLLGTSLGLTTLTGVSENTIGPVVGIIILLIGLSGSYRLIERVMIVLITVMSITFVTTMVTARPDPGDLFQGAFVPSIPTGAIITVIAIVGTTVVPYNLFLHSENVKERWSKPRHLKEARMDVVASIGLGGLITAAILITSGATIRGLEVESVADLALQLEPLLGSWATAFISIGLFAAGFSSALASPLGAAVTVSSVLKWERGMKNIRFKLVFLSVMAIGIISSGLGFEPLDVLLFAQALNGLILPFVSIMLLVIMNNKNRLGHYVNHWKMNLAGGIIVLVCVFLGVYSIVDAVMSFTS